MKPAAGRKKYAHLATNRPHYSQLKRANTYTAPYFLSDPKAYFKQHATAYTNRFLHQEYHCNIPIMSRLKWLSAAHKKLKALLKLAAHHIARNMDGAPELKR